MCSGNVVFFTIRFTSLVFPQTMRAKHSALKCVCVCARTCACLCASVCAHMCTYTCVCTWHTEARGQAQVVVFLTYHPGRVALCPSGFFEIRSLCFIELTKQRKLAGQSPESLGSASHCLPALGLQVHSTIPVLGFVF